MVHAGCRAADLVGAVNDTDVAERDVVDAVGDVAEGSAVGTVEYRPAVLEGAVVGADR